MIIKLGSWAGNPIAALLCEQFSRIEGISKKITPQRCAFRLGGRTLATVGLENGKPVVEFQPRLRDYAAAHGANFVKPHPIQAMAHKGWLQGWPTDDDEAGQIVRWTRTSAKEDSGN